MYDGMIVEAISCFIFRLIPFFGLLKLIFMKKILLFVTAILLLAHSYATSIIPAPKLNANEIYLPVGANGTTISLLELSTITTDRFETVSGRKMNFAEKISFKISQRKLRKSINPDGTIDNKRFEKLLAKRGGETGFHRSEERRVG